MSGPPKTPPRLHLIRGNPSKRPVKDSKKTAKKDEKGLPKIPQHLGAQGKYWFRRMAEELNAEGIISQLDARALEFPVVTVRLLICRVAGEASLWSLRFSRKAIRGQAISPTVR